MTNMILAVTRENSEQLEALFKETRNSTADQTWFVAALLKAAELLSDPRIYPQTEGIRFITLSNYKDKLRGEVRVEEDRIFIISLEQA